MRHKNILRITIATICILLIPLVAMQFTDEVVWTVGDFIFAGVLLFGSGLVYELAARKANTAVYKVAIGLAVATMLLLVWINAAVGIIGDDTTANLMYIGVFAAGFIGAIVSRLQPRGMSYVLFSMAAVQLAIPVAALVLWPDVSWGAPGVAGTFILNAFFALLFIGSALLFRQAWTEKINRRLSIARRDHVTNI
ncbi:MAG: hypothetical protein WC505_04475 [Patescibacteria group bacterium]